MNHRLNITNKKLIFQKTPPNGQIQYNRNNNKIFITLQHNELYNKIIITSYNNNTNVNENINKFTDFKNLKIYWII